MTDELPVPPRHEDLTVWAGEGRVVRASPADLVDWRLPAAQSDALVTCGVPLVEDLFDVVTFRSDGRVYRLAEVSSHSSGLASAFSAEPETGRVLHTRESGGKPQFVNSSINHWLCSLHLVGTWLTTSSVIERWDEDEHTENAALAELAALLEQIRILDPPACEGGDHESQYWPAVIDRWLY